MKKFINALCVLALSASFIGSPAVAQTAPDIARPEPPDVLQGTGPRPVYNAIPTTIDTTLFKFDQSGQRIPDAFVAPPLWEFAQFTDPLDHKKYQPIWVGAVPNKPVKSNLGLYVLAWKFTFANKSVTDATKPSCGDTVPVITRFINSPLLKPATFTSNGIALGSRQYIDAFQTAEFHGAGFPAGWQTNFVYKGVIAVSVTVPAADGTIISAKSCKGPIGLILQSWFDKVDQAAINQVVAKYKLSRTEIAFSLFNNTYMASPKLLLADCCIIGYHSAFGTNTTFGQLYGVGSYIGPGIFAGSANISALSHELGELINDPFVNNLTPAWGHIGQVGGCQGNYEVGDPLSGTSFGSTLNGFAYTLQDLANFSWFYRGTTANGLYLGTGGKYSFHGKLTSATLQHICS